MDGFFQLVYQITAKIPPGKVATYGQIAAMLGSPRAGRIVGWALRATPDGLNLPWQRVVNRFGGLAPNCYFGGLDIQRAMLEAEGVTFTSDGKVDLERHLWIVSLKS